MQRYLQRHLQRSPVSVCYACSVEPFLLSVIVLRPGAALAHEAILTRNGDCETFVRTERGLRGSGRCASVPVSPAWIRGAGAATLLLSSYRAAL